MSECSICGDHHSEGVCPHARPGSPKAREHGCTCERGEVFIGGERVWWQHAGCPLHGGHSVTPAALTHEWMEEVQGEHEATGAPKIPHRTRGGKGVVGRLFDGKRKA